MWRHLLALPSWVKGGLLAGSLPAVVLAAALIVGSAGGHSGNTEQDGPRAAAVNQTPTRSETATPAVTQMASDTPTPTEAPAASPCTTHSADCPC